MKKPYLLFVLLLICLNTFAQRANNAGGGNYTLFKPDRVFDGQQMHNGWWVLVRGRRIEAAGEPSSITAPATTKIVELKGMTLLPGFIEGHSHLFLHPYN